MKNNLIFEKVFNTIQPVNFREASGIQSEKEILKAKHFTVIVIEEVINLFNQQNLGLCIYNGLIYMFNGQYWSSVDENEFINFLGEAALKMEVDKFDAKYYPFRQNLYKQFCSMNIIPVKEIDKSKVLINLLNGTFEISKDQTGLRDFSADDFIIYQLPFEYNPNANAPMFMDYLNRVLPSEQLQKMLSEFIGYIFLKDLKLEKCLLLYGTGANGKSVFFDIINALLGKENISNLNMGNLNDANSRAIIANKLMNYGSELNSKDMQAETLKQLISGEPIECKYLYKDRFQCYDYARLMFNCNDLPRQVEHTEAYFRRFLIIPFNVTIPESERNPELAKKIIEKELSGIFNWVLEGLNRLIENKKFTISEESTNVLNEYRKESDSVAMFLEEQNIIPSLNSIVPLIDLYNSYVDYCKMNRNRECSRITFGKRLRLWGFGFKRVDKGMLIYAENFNGTSNVKIHTDEPTFTRQVNSRGIATIIVGKEDELPF